MAIPKVCGIETEYGVTLRGAADPNPVLASSMLINGYVEHHKVGWDFEDESPGRRRPRLRPRRRAAARDRDPPRQHGAHQRRPLLRRPRAPRVLHARVLRRARAGVRRQGGGADPRPFDARGARGSPIPGQEIVVYKNNSDGKGNSYGTHENYLVDRAVPFADARAQPAAVVREPPGVHRRRARSVPRTAPRRSTTRSASGPTSSRRRSASRPR